MLRIEGATEFGTRDFIAVEVFQLDTIPICSADDGAIQGPSDTVSKGHVDNRVVEKKNIKRVRNVEARSLPWPAVCLTVNVGVKRGVGEEWKE